MGMLIDGKWVSETPVATNNDKGQFVRAASSFRNWITSDGAPGPTGQGGFSAEAGRYHLYVSLACPWAHRTLIFRALKGLDKFITVSVVNPVMLENGWTFEEAPGVVPDELNHAHYLYEIYRRADNHYTGKATVPVLWDKKQQTIVSNESAEIIRMFNSAFDKVGALPGDYYPEGLRAEIDLLNDEIYPRVNNGVYRAGFATSQTAYEEAFTHLFAMLDKLDDRLSRQRYLLGNTVTEADWRLFTTLVRFDPVYFGHFKCNKKCIADYENLSGYLRDLYQQDGIADTVNFMHIKTHYYASHRAINPTGIVPLGPEIHLDLPHMRAALS
ncbi:glutathione S-transferase family protein [Microvirga sp. W0021]|uniref:Glutathione S-transferase family protein n=1 Tax=Hohaiivirga grylli TaxID=3133970 RepID=A0ABV0BJD2_9HYPH